MAARTDLFVDVIVPLALPQKYTYRVPQELNDEVRIGKRALVQFGKSKFYSAIIHNVHSQAPSAYTAKYIDSVIDEKPIVTEKQLKMWDWMSFYYMCGPGEVMNAALPSSLKLSSVSNIQLNPVRTRRGGNVGRPTPPGLSVAWRARECRATWTEGVSRPARW